MPKSVFVVATTPGAAIAAMLFGGAILGALAGLAIGSAMILGASIAVVAAIGLWRGIVH